MTIEAVIFDFDGLLMDTEGTMVASWQYEWRQHGLELDLAAFFADHGGDLTQERYAGPGAGCRPRLRPAGKPRPPDGLPRTALNSQLGLLPGIGAWLDEAVRLGLRLAVASSSPRSWVGGMLDRSGYRDRFETIACGDEVAAPKPDPAVYLLALTVWGFPRALPSRSRTLRTALPRPGRPGCAAWRFRVSSAI